MKNLIKKTIYILPALMLGLSSVKADAALLECIPTNGIYGGVDCIPPATAFSQNEVMLLASIAFFAGIAVLSVSKYVSAKIA